MKLLPIAARIYLIAIVISAIVVASIVTATVSLQTNWYLFAFWIGLYIFGDYFKARFKISKENSVNLNITEAITIFLLIVSNSMGLFVVIIGTLIANLLHLHHRKWYQILFNVADRIIIYGLLLGIYISLEQTTNELTLFLFIFVAHYLLDVGLLVTMIALSIRKPWGEVYVSSYGNTMWVHAITLPTGAVMALLWDINPMYILLSAGPLILALVGFRMIADLVKQTTLTTFLGVMTKMRKEDSEISKR